MNETTRTAPPIQLTGIESTQISAIGYDAASETLAIVFKTNPDKTYHYHGVTAEQNAEFEAAASKGSFFYKRIKGIAPFDRVEADGTISKSWAPDPAQEDPLPEAA
jgi:hypothetical protein